MVHLGTVGVVEHAEDDPGQRVLDAAGGGGAADANGGRVVAVAAGRSGAAGSAGAGAGAAAAGVRRRQDGRQVVLQRLGQDRVEGQVRPVDVPLLPLVGPQLAHLQSIRL